MRFHFQDLTGIDDIDRCKGILQTHNWDIEVAVQDTFNIQEGVPSVYQQPPPPEPREPTVNVQPPDQRIYTVAPRRPQGIVQWTYHIIFFPFRFIYSTILDIIRFAFRFIRPDPRNSKYKRGMGLVQYILIVFHLEMKCTSMNVTDPVGDVMRFISNYDECYGVIHPVFYQGTYSQALNDAKQELRFLLVYLHGDDHQDTPAFCRNTLGNQQLVDFVNGQLLFWACNTNSPEGFRVSRALRENTYPFLALIVLRQNKMTVVARIEGPVGPEELIQRLERNMSDNETSLIAARADREERNFTQTLRREQDAAYLESLKADQEKERKKQEEKLEKEKEQQKIVDAERERQRMLEERELRKEQLKREIPPEPNGSDPDVIKVVLKLPHGSRVERKFNKHQSLKYLYYFTFCHEDCPDDFHIVTNFPRRTLPCEPSEDNQEPISFAEAGLGKNEMLFVQDNES
ncbi:hypothetical protein FSP39_024113 [Pinctada imbricata]|uniref:UBX domain-containing protein n=1 Tax=Pinctada imbricata TaxID=66713 RepID=A0AA88XNV1_PINIB|nr:hypothetical protein FSP39_024113 [Pinctada imbricata]